MVALKQSVDNRCRFCTKVFCCSDCRDAHEDKKHPELNSSKPKCALCFKYDLPFDPRVTTSDSDYVCHVVINHLPLRCKICGEKFESNQAFQSAEPCKGPIKKPPPPEPTTAPLSTPLLIVPRPIDSKVTPVEQKLPLTPQYHSIEASSNALKSANLKLHPETQFDSPPELARHTSTPMHLSVLPKHHSHPPEFNFKTPVWQRTFDSTTGSSTCGSAVSVSGESRYFTARLSLEGSSINSASAGGNQGTPNWSSPVYPILKKQLEKQSSADDSPYTAGGSYRVAERSILKSALLSRIDDSTRDSIEKRVRFSDQFETPASSKSIMADTSANDNDEFFEARESLDDEEVKDNSPVVQEVQEKKAEDIGESKGNASAASISTSSLSSRVVMMLLVEMTTDRAKGFSSLDLAPLIDFGLKKLEESAASIDNSKSENALEGSIAAKAAAAAEAAHIKDSAAAAAASLAADDSQQQQKQSSSSSSSSSLSCSSLLAEDVVASADERRGSEEEPEEVENDEARNPKNGEDSDEEELQIIVIEEVFETVEAIESDGDEDPMSVNEEESLPDVSSATTNNNNNAAVSHEQQEPQQQEHHPRDEVARSRDGRRRRNSSPHAAVKSAKKVRGDDDDAKEDNQMLRKCTLCGKTYKRIDTFTRHMETCQAKCVKTRATTAKVATCIKCDTCPKTFNRASNYKRHIDNGCPDPINVICEKCRGEFAKSWIKDHAKFCRS